jgi:peptidylprolyl isomerase
MSTVETGMTVKVNYEGRLADGTVFDSSKEHDSALEFTVGEKQVIPGFDAALVGMTVGETKEVTIPAADAYGDRREELVGKVDRKSLPNDMEVQAGSRVEVVLQNDVTIPAVIVEMDDATVTIDANHPLAGKELTFSLELVEIVTAA